MKFSCSVDIDLPRKKVVELFDNPDNMKEWQDGFVSFTPMSGTSGETGAKSRIIYQMGKRKKEFELIETINIRNLPDEFSGTYEHKHMTNSMKNTFVELGENQTRWNADLEYIKLNGFMIKLMMKIMPGMARKQTQKWMDQFKVFAEKSAKA